MTPLEAARKMLDENQPQGIGENCWFCAGFEVPEPDWHFEHAPACPWLALPQIVAALEAAERVVNEFDESSLSGRMGPKDLDFHTAIEDLAEIVSGDEEA